MVTAKFIFEVDAEFPSDATKESEKSVWLNALRQKVSESFARGGVNKVSVNAFERGED